MNSPGLLRTERRAGHEVFLAGDERTRPSDLPTGRKDKHMTEECFVQPRLLTPIARCGNGPFLDSLGNRSRGPASFSQTPSMAVAHRGCLEAMAHQPAKGLIERFSIAYFVFRPSWGAIFFAFPIAGGGGGDDLLVQSADFRSPRESGESKRASCPDSLP